MTDKLKSYAAAKKEILPSVEHQQHQRLNNRAENSHDSDTVEGEEDAALPVCRSLGTVFGGRLFDWGWCIYFSGRAIVFVEE